MKNLSQELLSRPKFRQNRYVPKKPARNCLASSPFSAQPLRLGVSSLDRPKERNIQKRLTRLAGIGVNLPQELMPARIAVDLAVVGNSALDCRIEIASRLYRQAPLKLDVLGFKVLQMRRDGMQCCALGNVDQLRAIILHVLVSHNFVAASEQ